MFEKDLEKLIERFNSVKRSKRFISTEDYIKNLELIYDDCIDLLLRPDICYESITDFQQQMVFELSN